MCRFSLPPGYTRTQPVAKPKLGPLLPVIDAILEADRTGPVKQRHTAKRIFERLRDEHGFAGGYTVVKDYVRICRARSREPFVPPPRHRRRGRAKPGHLDHRSRHRRNYHRLIQVDADDMQRAPIGILCISRQRIITGLLLLRHTGLLLLRHTGLETDRR